MKKIQLEEVKTPLLTGKVGEIIPLLPGIAGQASRPNSEVRRERAVDRSTLGGEYRAPPGWVEACRQDVEGGQMEPAGLAAMVEEVEPAAPAPDTQSG